MGDYIKQYYEEKHPESETFSEITDAISQQVNVMEETTLKRYN